MVDDGRSHCVVSTLHSVHLPCSDFGSKRVCTSASVCVCARSLCFYWINILIGIERVSHGWWVCIERIPLLRTTRQQVAVDTENYINAPNPLLHAAMHRVCACGCTVYAAHKPRRSPVRDKRHCEIVICELTSASQPHAHWISVANALGAGNCRFEIVLLRQCVVATTDERMQILKWDKLFAGSIKSIVLFSSPQAKKMIISI